MSFKKYIKQLALPESYISITLGFLVVLVAGLLVYNYVSKNKPGESSSNEVTSAEKTEEKMELPTTHTVVAGETLWSIAEKFYNSGYNWVTIASENKLSDPSTIEVGQILSLPKAETIRPENENIAASSTEVTKTYTVMTGDYLWEIAVEQYGDGYAWLKIARANNLVNPNLIHPGNALTIPR